MSAIDVTYIKDVEVKRSGTAPGGIEDKKNYEQLLGKGKNINVLGNNPKNECDPDQGWKEA